MRRPLPRPALLLGAAPAPLLFILGAISQYAGAALAVGLFAIVSPVGIAWLRIVGAAVALAVWRRPWRRGRWGRRRLVLTAAFGVALTSMNVCFYLAIEQLPLGTAVAIEFIGPVAVAAVASRTPRAAVALGLATVGVLLCAGVRIEGSPLGVAFALAAAVLWAAYVLLGARVAARGDGIDGLAAGTAIGAVALLPLAVPLAGHALTDPRVIALGLAVGVLSNAVPYGLDQVVLRRVPAGTFALLLSLLPATATAVGALALGQIPRPAELAGIALVVVAVAIRDRPA